MRQPSDFAGIPRYGVLTDMESWYWYNFFHWYWMRYTEGKVKDDLVNGSDAFVNANWPLMSKEQKTAVWALMTHEERERIRTIRSNR